MTATPSSTQNPTALARIAILDDYQQCVHELAAYELLAGRSPTLFHDSLKDEAALVQRLRPFHALVTLRDRTPLSSQVLEQLPNLRLISAAGSFSTMIDRDACSKLGIATAESSGTGGATAELCWTLILASRRKLLQEAESLRQGRWQSQLGQSVRGQVFGVWGYGNVGRQLAQYAHVFGMQVTVWGSERARQQAILDGFRAAASRAAFFTESDVLSLQIKLTPETAGIVTPADLALMKPTALLVNTARAELIQPGALADAVLLGRPGFAALDVFENEPLSPDACPLLHHPHVLLTPHIGFVERSNFEALYRGAFHNLLQFEQEVLSP